MMAQMKTGTMLESSDRGTVRGRRRLDHVPRVGEAVELIALGQTGEGICARTIYGRDRVLVREPSQTARPVAGELFTLEVSRRTRESLFWCLEGRVAAIRLEPEATPFEPMALLPRGSVEDSTGRPRTCFELEPITPIVPGLPVWGSDAIREIEMFKESGDREIAEQLAGELLTRDLRCIEAHALLGDLFREGPLEHRWTERALRHYRVGAAIGDRSVAVQPEGLLPWRWPGNRAYLRCLYWQARCLERLGDAAPAWTTLNRLLELSPDDPLQVRELLDSFSS